MIPIIISNTNQMSNKVHLLVVSHEEDKAIQELKILADKKGLKLSKICLFAGCYYYGEVESK